MPPKAITIRLDEALHKKLKLLSVHEGCSIQQFVENLIVDAVNEGPHFIQFVSNDNDDDKQK